MQSLVPVEDNAALGEFCKAGNGSLLVNMSLPRGASSGSCWWAYVISSSQMTTKSLLSFSSVDQPGFLSTVICGCILV
jgi:hypothetical protein